jgi:hypothetical protein
MCTKGSKMSAELIQRILVHVGTGNVTPAPPRSGAVAQKGLPGAAAPAVQGQQPSAIGQGIALAVPQAAATAVHAQLAETLQAMQQQMQELRQDVHGVKALVVSGFNCNSRVHNYTSSMDGPLLPLHKEVQPQGQDGAAFGSLPPPGLFPPTWSKLHGEVKGELSACLQQEAGYT